MISRKAKSLLSIMFAGLIIAFIVQIAEINTTEAQNGPPVGGPPVGGPPIDVPSGGKNIINDKPSNFHIPLHHAELKEIDDQLIQNPSEDARNQLIGQKKQIYNDIEKWFADNLDPAKEQAAREKQKLLNAYLAEEWSNEENIEELEKTLPFVTVGYDYVNNALEVTIETSMFNDGNINVYLEKIRSIIGDEIDLTLAPREYPISNSCNGRKSHCDPIRGGVEFGMTDQDDEDWVCSVGFKATYFGQEGFVTAGHCFDFLFQDVRQPGSGSNIGKVIKNFNSNSSTDCDCAFVTSNRPVGNGKIYDRPDVSTTGFNTAGKAITMSGRTSGIESGAILGIDISLNLGGRWIFGLIEADYYGQSGDSGAPVMSQFINEITEQYELLGIHEAGNSHLVPKSSEDLRSWYTRRSKFETHFSNFSWGF